MIDEWGGIDKKIKKLVLRLNFLGIPTTGSCEGHIDRGSPVPWIKVTVPHEPLVTKQSMAMYHRWQNKNKKIQQNVSDLLSEFYGYRDAPRNIRLIVETANSGFWIHNGGSDYARWRSLIDKNVAKIQKKGNIDKKEINKKEFARRAKKLPLYQKEVELFTKFLEKKVSSNRGI